MLPWEEFAGYYQKIVEWRSREDAVILLGCGKEKRRHESPALQLYNGSFFQRTRQTARLIVPAERIYILSARYKLISGSRVIKPYDLNLNDLPATDYREWVDVVRRQIEGLQACGKYPIYLCGTRYQAVSGLPTVLPNYLRIGHRLQWMIRLAKEFKEWKSHVG